MDAIFLASLFPAFLTGLAGSGHCAAMCAAPMAAVTTAAPIRFAPAGALATAAHFAVAAQAGRIASYALAGALAGWAGSALGALPGREAAPAVAALVALAAQCILLLTGFYLMGHSGALGWLERAVRPLWRGVQPLVKRAMPVTTRSDALVFGALWGWVPCGLSWSMLAVAFAAGGSPQGASTMIAFGLGTLPVMLGMSVAAQSVAARLREPHWRTAAGCCVVALALFGIARIAFADPRMAELFALCVGASGVPR
jgi:uncharacterized protein